MTKFRKSGMKRFLALFLAFGCFLSLPVDGCADIADYSQYGYDDLDFLQRLKETYEHELEAVNNRISELTNEKPAADTWQIKNYVDEFKLPTDKRYITNKDAIVGTFSNSATTNSTLYARILIDASDVSIFLYEYGSYEVNNDYSSKRKTYTIKVLDDNQQRHTFSGFILPDGDRIYIESTGLSSFIKLLANNSKLSFYITAKSDEYWFTVNSSESFSELYSTVTGKEI